MNAEEARELKKYLLPFKKWIYCEIKRRIVEGESPLVPHIDCLEDTRSVWIDQRARIGDGAFFFPPVYVRGESIIGKNVVIQEGSTIENSVIDDDCEIGRFAEIIESRIGKKSKIDHARIEKSAIGEKCVIGYTAQIKRSKIGDGVNAVHHCYIGDAVVGNKVNIGAGLITANYDGVNKNKTLIEDGAFIGTNVNIVAPLTIGREAMVAAGSTITQNVKPYTLVLARAIQNQSKSRYHRRTEKDYRLSAKIPKELLAKLKSACKFGDEELYEFLTMPNQRLNGNMPIDFLFGENAEQVFKQCLALILTYCNNTPH